MNYIKQLNGFWRWRRQNVLSAYAQSLWYSLMAEQNAQMWAEEVTLPTALLRHWMGDVGINTFRRAREALVSADLVKVREGDGRHECCHYHIVQLYDDKKDPQTDSQADPLKSPQCAENEEGPQASKLNTLNINRNENGKQGKREMSEGNADRDHQRDAACPLGGTTAARTRKPGPLGGRGKVDWAGEANRGL